MSRSGAERISAHRNNHGFRRSGLSVLICCHGLERISRECHGADRSRYPLVQKVTDYHGADIRPLEMSRIGADWAIRSVIIRITDYISIRTHPCYFSVLSSTCGTPSVRAVLYRREMQALWPPTTSQIYELHPNQLLCCIIREQIRQLTARPLCWVRQAQLVKKHVSNTITLRK